MTRATPHTSETLAKLVCQVLELSTLVQIQHFQFQLDYVPGYNYEGVANGITGNMT